MAMTWAMRDDSRDLMVRGGTLAVAYGAEEVRQRIITHLLHHWQEYFLNVPAGLPWYDLILGSKDRRLVEALVRQAILDVPGVAGLPSLTLVWDAPTRGLAIYFVAQTATDVVSGAVTAPGGG